MLSRIRASVRARLYAVAIAQVSSSNRARCLKGEEEHDPRQIVALWQNYDSPDVVTTDVTKDWLDALRAFKEKVDRKYGRRLASSGSGNWVKDASKKVLWLKEKEDILHLRSKLTSASDTITMLTLSAMGFVTIPFLKLWF